MNILSLCTGYGGLDMAAVAVFCGTVIAVADNDRDATTVLAHHHPDVPNLGDITTVDWSGVSADVITAGYPCQPFSTVGQRKGTDDPRHLWPHLLRAIRMVGPRIVILENVAGHLSLGFDTVLSDLAASGFDAEWAVVRASDVGAPHRRARLFVVAQPASDPDSKPTRRDPRSDAHPQTADEDRAAEHGHRPADGPYGPWQPAIDRWAHIVGRPAPEPFHGTQLSARLSEWMMGLPDGWVTNHIPNRRALKVLGNGVVPQQASYAIRTLTERTM